MTVALFEDRVCQQGSRRELGGKDAFLLTGIQRCFYVQSGCLDLFSVFQRNGEPIGARAHVLRIESGGIVPVVDVEGRSEVALLAVPGPNSVILELDLPLLADAADDERIAEAFGKLIERWIDALAARLLTDQPDGELRMLSIGESLALDEQFPVRTKGVLWVRHLSGTSKLFGTPKLQINGEGYFPLAPTFWLMPNAGARVKCAPTSELLTTGELWKSLAGFHSVILQVIEQQRSDAVRQEQERILRKEELRDRAFGDALESFAALLEPEEDTYRIDPENVFDPLFAACCLVGSKMRLTFREHADARSGRTISDPLNAILAASKLRKRLVRLTGEWWRSDAGPLLGFANGGNDPVALLPGKDGKYRCVNPADGSTVVVDREVAASLDPNAVTFYRPFPEKKLKGSDLLRYGAFGNGRDALVIAFIGSVGGIIAILVPYLTGVIFDSVIPGARYEQLLQIVLILGTGAFATTMFNITKAIAVLRIESRMGASIQAAVWDRVLALPVPFFREYTPGNLAVRANGIEAIRAVISGTVMSSILAGIFSVFYFGLLFYYSMRLALIATGLVLVALLVTVATSYVQLQYERKVHQLATQISGRVFQFICGIAKLRVTGTESTAFSIWSRMFTRQREYQLRARHFANILDTFIDVFPILCSILLFHQVAVLVEKGLITTGVFLAFNAAFVSFLSSALQMANSASMLLMTAPLFENAKPILEALPEVHVAKPDPGRLRGAIELNQVTFRYGPELPPVLRDISIEVKPGEFVAFVGPSGSGKSTIFRLLLGFERPEAGTIFYDGQDLAGLDVGAVRRQLGVVLQNGKLLSGDIFSNIVGSSTTLTLEDAWEAARMAGLAEDIEAMPMGMHTVVSEGGGTLSGGQRQRLMIARAIVHRPSIMLMDEATSALDNRTQEIVSRSLESLKATRIVIAHRLSTVIHADRIILIDKGEVREAGTYDELMAMNGMFAELARRQLA